ncbi:hypothetical protein GXY_00104 [Novacetimonas hansenii ATCC 23769]|uniref:Uncharacterized protein n=1 Tax=Novacetimonas hansenii ATCC 23769 TaxID=714995 RepID=D5QA86_NOVHA|nr:hypothetical protein GXY_00104 [Novacetimonas hansenii ATCC 23769]
MRAGTFTATWLYITLTQSLPTRTEPTQIDMDISC